MKIIRIERIREKENPNRSPLWMLGFTDLTTILLAFFILLFSTAQPKHDWNEASRSLRSSFGGDKNAIELRGETGDGNAEKTWKSEDRDPGLNLDYLYSIVKKYLLAEPALKTVQLTRQGNMVILSFGNELGFSPGDSDVSMQGRALLDKLVPLLISLPNRLEIMGHADNTPVQSDARYNSNWQLSLMRSMAVADILSRFGYDRPIGRRGKGTVESAADKQSDMTARRVDLRLYMVHP